MVIQAKILGYDLRLFGNEDDFGLLDAEGGSTVLLRVGFRWITTIT
jgi:hypothetical protein